MSHLCGLCLALRDDHGQLARVATNYDALVISVLVSAQAGSAAATRTAGPCPLRGMRRAEVAEGDGARLAAAVSLLLAATRIDDHTADGDGVYARRGVQAVARTVSGRWGDKADLAGRELGFDSSAVLAVLERQSEVECSAGPGSDILSVTQPTEHATGAAFAHTAVLARKPANEAPLREAGRLFGRIAHLLDAVEDQEEDHASGAWNPITATRTDPAEVRRLCDDAVLGVRYALREVDFADERLAHALLAHELQRSVERTFAHAGHPPPGPSQEWGRYPTDQWHPHGHPPPGQGGGGPYGSGYGSGYGSDGYGDGHEPARDQGGSCCSCKCETPKRYEPPKKRGPITGSCAALFMCCTCQLCCRDPHPGPWSGERKESWGCDVGSPGCCDCCDCDCG